MATNLAVDDNLISEAQVIGGCKTKKAAECYNICRSAGIQGSHIDFLICAFAERENAPIFTTDKDFFHYAKRRILGMNHRIRSKPESRRRLSGLENQR